MSTKVLMVYSNVWGKI